MEVAHPFRQRAELLLGQRRYDLAEREVRQWLASDPNDATAYSYLAVCLGEAERWQEATDAAQRGISLSPDSAYAHYVLANIYADRNMYAESRRSIQESLRLAPDDPDAWAVAARIELSEKNHERALNAAEAGLKFNPEHEACINLRSLALTNLGRRSEAGEAIASTLSRNPLNASSHANMGWTLLNQGKARPAMEHFREALRLSPDMEWARSGVIEAMKARSPIYRLFLAYFLFMARLKGRAQWLILIGAFVAFRVLDSVSKSNPAAAPYLKPLVIGYLVFALGTVVAYPLFNLLLFLDPFGRLVLRREQRIGAAIFGVSLVPPIVFLSLWATTGGDLYELCSLVTAVLIIPISLAGLMRAGTPRLIMSGLAALLTLACAAIVYRAFQGQADFVGLYAIACFGSTWIANFASSAQPARKY